MESAEAARTEEIRVRAMHLFESQPWWRRLLAYQETWKWAWNHAEIARIQSDADALIRQHATRMEHLEAIAAAAQAFRSADPSSPRYIDSAEELDMALAAIHE